MGVKDEVGRHAMEAVGKSKTGGTETVPAAVPDPPQVGRVKAAPKIGNRRPTRNVGIVAKRATKKDRQNWSEKPAKLTLCRRIGRIRN